MCVIKFHIVALFSLLYINNYIYYYLTKNHKQNIQGIKTTISCMLTTRMEEINRLKMSTI